MVSDCDNLSDLGGVVMTISDRLREIAKVRPGHIEGEAAAEIDRLTGEVSRQQEAIEVAMETATMFDPESVKHAKIQMMTIAQTLSEAHDPQFRTDFQRLRADLAKTDILTEALEKIAAKRYGAQGIMNDGGGDAEIRDYFIEARDLDRHIANTALTAYRGSEK